MANLTPKQLHVLRLIDENRRKKGYAPTMQELADRLNVSKVTVFEHVEALVKKGMLKRDPNKARSLEVSPNFAFPPEDDFAGLPLMGSIAAGKPFEPFENRETLDPAAVFPNNGRTYVLKVRGDSMIDKHICDGDFVIIHRQDTANEGDIVVAMVNGADVTLKTYHRERDRVRLDPANPMMQPIYADDVRIQGVVVGVMRRYAYRAR